MSFLPLDYFSALQICVITFTPTTMQRRNFLSTAVFGTTLTQVSAETKLAPTAPFVIRSGESRFQESTQVGLSPNNIKVSSKDTSGQLTVFSTLEEKR
jgi:hypothetical protein